MNTLAKKEREQILKLFVDVYTLTFSQIEKEVRIRSNMVAYHLEQLRKQGLLKKQGTTYALTKKGESYLPIVSHIDKRTPLPVILIAPIKKGKVLLIQRKKRPYKDHWALIGGKMQFGETLQQSCARKLAEQGIRGKMIRCNAVAQEQIEEDGEIKHSFLLYFVTATCDAKEKWFSTNELKKTKIIPSDLWLLQHKIKSKIDIQLFNIHERHGELSKFRSTDS